MFSPGKRKRGGSMDDTTSEKNSLPREFRKRGGAGKEWAKKSFGPKLGELKGNENVLTNNGDLS